jgi:hypothetical protein
MTILVSGNSQLINGNGTFTTPEIEVTEKGWYVWVEEIESTTYTEVLSYCRHRVDLDFE